MSGDPITSFGFGDYDRVLKVKSIAGMRDCNAAAKHSQYDAAAESSIEPASPPELAYLETAVGGKRSLCGPL
eukprot:CAMPEP_0205858980 /NCGR_PEP_ID=MMETSP1083-20121108/4487_1 /ASSEMBLY_ACC=CAM_ASM_000430 /TAXON_ID=97485 /ORGANISM="Prymnesium parvum, Strain Texoma1" /LENGTH=71 /DNA_ID=CAMNT_0053220577 /DNA_START=193 /DNA_END=409 /DNA_ORIENTATION=+